MNIRIGNGYDIHRLGSDRALILGGVKIEHHLGLLGHSDADVLTHAIMDAMLGALSLGDIGHYFPPTDDRWKGANSLDLLAQVNRLILEKGWRVNNIDSTVVAERPKLKPHIGAMRDRLAAVLELNPELIGIKATTNEKLGPVGREEGIAAYAVALLVSDRQESKIPAIAAAQNEIIGEEEPAIVADTVAFDAKGEMVLLAQVEAKKQSSPDKVIERIIPKLQAAKTLIPFAAIVDLEKILIFQWNGIKLLNPVISLKAEEILSHYDRQFSQKRIFYNYLNELFQAWLDDLAYRWKSQIPPALEQVEAIGLLPRLTRGSADSEVVLQGEVYD